MRWGASSIINGRMILRLREPCLSNFLDRDKEVREVIRENAQIRKMKMVCIIFLSLPPVSKKRSEYLEILHPW